MTGQVRESRGEHSFMHFESSWPEEVRCDWCYTERYKNKAELRVELYTDHWVKLCLPCWFALAFFDAREMKHG